MDGYYINTDSLAHIHFREIRLSTTLSFGLSYQIEVLFELVHPLTITQSSKDKGNSSNLALLNTMCELRLQDKNGNERRFVLNSYDDCRLYIGGNTIFSIPIECQEMEELANSIDSSSSIKWKLSGYLLVLDQGSTYPPIQFFVTNWQNSIRPMIPENFLKDLKLKSGSNSVFTDEFPTTIPVELTNTTTKVDHIQVLKNDLENNITNLQKAVNSLKTNSNDTQFVEVMNNIKTSLDVFTKYDNFLELGNELLIKAGIIAKVDGEGGENEAAEQFMNSVFSILKNNYQIASKAAHRRTIKTNKRFGLNPTNSEALFVTEIALTLYKYFLNRLNYYVKTQNCIVDD